MRHCRDVKRPLLRQARASAHIARPIFGCLREFARRNAFVILALDAQFVTSGELVILRWLAEAQRQTGLRTCHFQDIGLKSSLRYCADALKDLGVALPSQTLHIHTDLDDDPPLANSHLYRAAGKDGFMVRAATGRRSGRT